MEKYNVLFKKKYGQNFLKDDSVAKRIVDSANISSNSLTIEVGVGGGILTKELAKVSKNVLAYEIDTSLEDEIIKRLGDYNNVTVLYEDFLSSDLCTDISKYEYEYLYFVSNVPYYITTPIIMKLLDCGIYFENIVLMVQKEVGLRFTAKPGTRSYGSISVFLQYFYDVNQEFNVMRDEFIPEPDVDSVVVSFKKKKQLLFVKNMDFFKKLIRDSFQFKRKNIKNNLKKYDLNKIEQILKKYGFDLSSRAEMLDVKIFVDLANSLC